MTKRGRASRYNRRLRIERPLEDEAADGAGSGSWPIVGNVSAEVQDILPSRSERLADGINLSARLARVRMNYRSDIVPGMRFVMATPFLRTMHIISGPAEIGFREEIEFIVEDFPSGGGGS